MSSFNQVVKDALTAYLLEEHGIVANPEDFNSIVMQAAQAYLDDEGLDSDIIQMSGVAVSHTGNTTETALVSIPIPPLGPNDQIVLSALVTYTNSVNIKNIRARLSTTAGVSGTAMFGLSPTTTATQRITFEIANQGATNSQVGGAPTGGTAATTGAVTTATVETNAGGFLNITAQLADAGETVTLRQYRVEVVRG